MEKNTCRGGGVGGFGKLATIGRTKNMAKDMPDMKFLVKVDLLLKVVVKLKNSRRKRTRLLMAVRKTKAGLALKRWFKEDWKDVRTGKACGDAK